jgi:hypothetical protein
MIGLSLWTKIPQLWSTIWKKIYQGMRELSRFFFLTLENSTDLFVDQADQYQAEELNQVKEAFLIASKHIESRRLRSEPWLPEVNRCRIMTMDQQSCYDQLKETLRVREFWSTKSAKADMVLHLVFDNQWGSPLAGSNIVGFQAMCRKRLACMSTRGKQDELLNICRNVSLPDDALSSICQTFIMRNRYSLMKKQKAIKHTAFPRLGQEMKDGCDCWLEDPTRNIQIPKDVLTLLFGRVTPSPTLLLGGSTWLVKRYENRENIVIKEFNDTFFIYSATDCHLKEGASVREEGHSFSESIVIRKRENQCEVLSFIKRDALWMDLTSLVEDQHVHIGLVRSFIEPTKRVMLVGATSDERVKMKYIGDRLVTADEKSRLRRERRAQASSDRKNGIKPVKSWQVPIRFRGLTTPEYHEMRLREQEDIEEWYKSQGRHAYPQAVREWLKSTSGAAQWNQIHAFAVDRSDMAKTQLSKVNKFLMKLGLKMPIPLNENLVESMRQKKERALENRERQLEAKQKCPDNLTMAQQDWHRKQQKKLEQNQRQILYEPTGENWADVENGDTLPDLAW